MDSLPLHRGLHTIVASTASAEQNASASCAESFSSADWGTTYALACAGGVLYMCSIVSFVLVHRFRERIKAGEQNLWSPLRVKQRGLTQVAVVAALCWFLHNLLLELVPCSTSDRMFDPTAFTCYARAVWRTAAACFFASSITSKQYKAYTRYVLRERRLPTWVYVLLCCLPYLVLIALPVWREWNSRDNGRCEEDSKEQKAMFAWTSALLGGTAVLYLKLRDPFCPFPNRVSSTVETVGFAVVVAAWAFRLWADQVDFYTRCAVLAGVLAVVPNVMYWAALGAVLWHCSKGDVDFCLHFQRTYAPVSVLVEGSPVPSTPRYSVCDDGVSKRGGVTASPVPSPQHSVGYAGEFFETDKLASLIDSGDKHAVSEFLQYATIGLLDTFDRNGYTPLHRAVVTDSSDITDFLLEMGAMPNAPSRDGDTALHLAAQLGSRKMVTALSRRCDLDAVSARGETPVTAAIAASHDDTALLLLSLGARLDRPATDGPLSTPSLVPVGSEAWELAHVDNAGKARGSLKQPLILAAESGRVELVRDLLDAASRRGELRECLYRCSTHGLSPLMIAIRLGHMEAATALVGAGADVWQLNPTDKRSVLHYNAMQNTCGVPTFTKIRAWCLQADPQSPGQRPVVNRSVLADSEHGVTDRYSDSPHPGVAYTDSLPSEFAAAAVSVMPRVGRVRNQDHHAAAAALLRSPSCVLQTTPVQHPAVAPSAGTPIEQETRPGGAMTPFDSVLRDITGADVHSAAGTVDSADALPRGNDWSQPTEPQQLFSVFLSMPDVVGRSPLHYAVLRGDEALVMKLLSEGSVAKLKDLKQKTPRDYAMRRAKDRQHSPTSSQYNRIVQLFHEHSRGSAGGSSRGVRSTARAGNADSLVSFDSVLPVPSSGRVNTSILSTGLDSRR
eukprot:TRINITY_DN14340_c0_g1_i1.p1 TRINITY_DN14340_c0_g1~~TRINITY_DN14340_c0_g1_i1.p1  ORF type:complete len:900 (+),score=257.02 TRINITY_DN14340_c0_g1_i1:56-2755(+)